MSLPLPALTFYRLPDVAPAAATIAGLLDAIYTALSSATDYLGATVAATHRWTIGREVAGSTVAVYASAPVGTPMGLAPVLAWAGAAAGAPTMASPDSFTANNLLMSITKNGGAWSAWTNATPAGGTFSGWWRGAGTTYNAVTAIVRAFVSQEMIFLQLIANPTTQTVLSQGAWVEPITDYVTGGGVTSEADDRLYGMWTTGGLVAWRTDNWLGQQGTVDGCPLNHTQTAGNNHAMVFTPGAGTLIPCGRPTWNVVTTTTMAQDSAGAYALVPVQIYKLGGGVANRPNGAYLGSARANRLAGQIQSGRLLSVGTPAVPVAHAVSPNTGGAQDVIMLAAAS